MSHISTPYAFQMDIDFIPHNGLYKSLTKYIVELNITQKAKIAIVVPAFETQRYRYLSYFDIQISDIEAILIKVNIFVSDFHFLRIRRNCYHI